ncbi:unnamed protein product [Ranitomeya imitator]|uniref:Uncharacterized protein n=1 Tax=Ranitomeya imitator TaxID=111125 RepID=A0ABN9KWG6_9NEOB|nr:unnamed protein product [Ranitomeya imitator]
MAKIIIASLRLAPGSLESNIHLPTLGTLAAAIYFIMYPPHAVKLLSVLKHMPQKTGPDAFFNFPGKSAAVRVSCHSSNQQRTWLFCSHFVGGCLIITSIKSKGKGFQHCVKYDFKPQKWYMVSIVHIYNRWKNSELRCFVNGELASYGEITWLVNTSDTFDKCFLGSSETADANRVFCGQMASVYLFSEALNAAQIFAIYQLGPSYKGTFKFKAER